MMKPGGKKECDFSDNECVFGTVSDEQPKRLFKDFIEMAALASAYIQSGEGNREYP